MLKRLLILVLVICILAVGGLSAAWVYPDNNAAFSTFSPSMLWALGAFKFVEGSDDMVSSEVIITGNFISEIIKVENDPDSTEMDEIFANRQSSGGTWVSVNEMAANAPGSDGAKLREILGMDKHPDVSVIIKFVNGDPGYELFTTRINVDARDEQTGEYIIPESMFQNECMFLYPVHRIVFSPDGEGGYVARQATPGYSRTIYYWDTDENGNYGQSTTRSFDVSTWAEGNSHANAVELEEALLNNATTITVQNIDEQKEVFFKFTVGGFSGASAGTYKFNTTTPGLTGRIYNSSYTDVTGQNLTGGLFTGSTYYLKLTYSAVDTISDFVFTLSR